MAQGGRTVKVVSQLLFLNANQVEVFEVETIRIQYSCLQLSCPLSNQVIRYGGIRRASCSVPHLPQYCVHFFQVRHWLRQFTSIPRAPHTHADAVAREFPQAQ